MTLADPLDPSADETAPRTGRPRRRWEVWRSPDRQPAWARPTLLVIAAVAAALYAWNITEAGLAPYSAIAMVLGYNGVERFGVSFPGAVTSGPGVTSATSAGGATPPKAKTESGSAPGGADGGGGGSGTGTGWTKLLGSEYGTQIGWLYPLAVPALVFGLAWTRRTRRTRRARRTQPARQVRGGFAMWGTWLATYGLIFSKMSTIPHTAYVSSLAPPLAALSGAGIVMFWRAYRAEGWRGWVLPLAVAAEAAWAYFLWRDHAGFLPWARDLLVVAGAVAVVALVVVGLSRRARARVVTVALGTGVTAMLVAPATWAASVLDVSYAGTSFNATAGPSGGLGGFSGSGQQAGGRPQAGGHSAEFADRFAERAAEGGGSTPPGGGSAPGGIGSSATTTLTSDAWVESACKAVPAADYATTAATAATAASAGAGEGSPYACSAATAS
jgi:hypothetical protein